MCDACALYEPTLACACGGGAYCCEPCREAAWPSHCGECTYAAPLSVGAALKVKPFRAVSSAEAAQQSAQIASLAEFGPAKEALRALVEQLGVPGRKGEVRSGAALTALLECPHSRTLVQSLVTYFYAMPRDTPESRRYGEALERLLVMDVPTRSREPIAALVRALDARVRVLEQKVLSVQRSAKEPLDGSVLRRVVATLLDPPSGGAWYEAAKGGVYELLLNVKRLDKRLRVTAKRDAC